MNLRYLYRGLKIDNRTRDYINRKIETVGKMLNTIFFSEVAIELDKKGKFCLKAVIKTPYRSFRSTKTTESVEGCIDEVEEDLQVQIFKCKDRRMTLIKRGGRSIKKMAVIDQSARFRKS